MLCNIKVSKLKNFKVNPLGLVYGADYTDDYAGTRILADRVDFSVLGNDEERYYPKRVYKVGVARFATDKELEDFMRKIIDKFKKRC